ncbi:Protein mac-1 [Caenorhabditis elegans]|uniref:Protein mac-1 n=1 Tax=Caenorhabditis elegans TaxID=6239 RepID=MAC1_CAEEL|nr:Protein mac-1 [Caenorhabditis elegans]Q9NAG4.2 RecName: Full=Protein mac-1; AltName: Full=Member of AAA family that binds ced-4 [Caenorhabditis elegans]CAB55106.2 Protein mac-1 [Caenorhabditis elegans]|eukprot:NP_496814.1 Protein mac-1 [Caenorhabditis elegans]
MPGGMGFPSDPALLPRVQAHIRKFPGTKYFKPELVAYDLQQEHPEYQRKNHKVFMGMVREALERIQLVAKEENDEKMEEKEAMDDVQEIPIVKALETRKRKAPAAGRKSTGQAAAAKEVVLSDDSEDERAARQLEKQIESLKTNRANKTVLNLYTKKSAPSTPVSTPKNQATKKPPGASAAPPALPRGLGAVSDTISPRESHVKFEHIGGADRQFLEVCRLAMHLKRPKTFATLGVDPPRGFIVHGPPGCGKTMFAQAVAGELAIPMLQLAATELVSGVSGETEEKIRRLFDTAKQNSPCILILDDIDAIAPRRETAQREMERRVVSQLCSSLDELVLPPREKPLKDQLTFGDDGSVAIIGDSPTAAGAGVLVIGTTSRPDAVDGGLRRAGRFENEISLGIPDETAREKILEKICKVNLAGDVTLKQIAKLTPGYVGADLQALIREAAKVAIDRVFDTIVVKNEGHKNLTVEQIKEELDRVLAWLQGDDDPSALSELNGGLQISFEDFERALSTIQPAAKREGFATVPDVSWDDIGALVEVRKQLEWSILYPIKRADDFAALGIDCRPQGILLCGPPGCGKTLLAKAVANETGMNFISVKGPELLNMYVGESERAVRTVFQRARDSQPCVIFFDEIDALVPKRSHGESSGGARLVNQLLTEMDGVEGRQKVFLIGATNRPDIVDAAILRPGRLDKILFVDFPSVEDRVDILRKSTKNGTRPMLGEDIDFHEIAQLPELAGFTGADLAALIHESSLLALQARVLENDESVKGVGMRHFREAASRIRPSVTEADRKKYEHMKKIYGLKQATPPSV